MVTQAPRGWGRSTASLAGHRQQPANRDIPLLPRPTMPTNKAWNKPGVNANYVASTRKVAQSLQAVAPADEFEAKLVAMVAASGKLPTNRKEDARRSIQEACQKLRCGCNPLSGLKPPPDCPPCNGSSGGTHDFLCLSRERTPQVEKVLRAKLFGALNSAWLKATTQMVSLHTLHCIARSLYLCICTRSYPCSLRTCIDTLRLVLSI